MKKIAYLLLLTLTISLFSGCSGCRKKGVVDEEEKIELVYYRLYDEEEVFEPIIQEFQKQNPNITIKYRMFTDIEEYENLIVNELAEGEGPDMFSVHNSWLLKHQNKISPAPDVITAADFSDVFVKVCTKDLIRVDSDNKKKVFGLPLFVDSLGLYYNKDHFEDKIPEKGKPSETWEELKDDVFKLTEEDNSFERFESAGIAMGRADNILRAVDILYMLMLQNNTDFYNSGYSQAVFAEKQDDEEPGIEALELFASFGQPDNKNYSWNDTISDADSAEKEIIPFVKGKVSMIIGYSYLYEEIMNQIVIEDKKGYAIDRNDVKVAAIPQMFEGTKNKATFADYFAETVSRNTEYPNEAWQFLEFLTRKENAKKYHEETNRPPSRRDLIEDQKSEPIYGIFAAQSGYADSYLMMDDVEYDDIFESAIGNVVAGEDAEDALMDAQNDINDLLPSGGFLDTLEPKEENNN